MARKPCKADIDRWYVDAWVFGQPGPCERCGKFGPVPVWDALDEQGWIG